MQAVVFNVVTPLVLFVGALRSSNSTLIRYNVRIGRRAACS
jgi:hypothetical protein